MYSKIAFKNVKKSFKDYTIYFFTLMLAVCIFYTFNSVESQKAMSELTSSGECYVDILSKVISYVSVFIAFILGSLILYANNFLVKKRNKELGIYMTLGMSKNKISKILILETIIVGILSLISGLILGLIFRGQIIIDGLNSGKKIEKIINKICKEKNIENINQIETNLLIPSVDLNDGKIYFFTSFEKRQRYSDQIIYVNDINIGKAVRASCTYPGVFSPCEYNDTYLVDGGIRENVPWKGLKENGADCVTFEEELKEKKKANIVDAIFDSLSILCHELSTYELHEADYLIKIKTKKVSLLDTSQIDYLYNEGYNQAKKFLKETNIKL